MVVITKPKLTLTKQATMPATGDGTAKSKKYQDISQQLLDEKIADLCAVKCRTKTKETIEPATQTIYMKKDKSQRKLEQLAEEQRDQTPTLSKARYHSLLKDRRDKHPANDGYSMDENLEATYYDFGG